MGSGEEEYNPRKQANINSSSSSRKYKIQMLIVVIFTNLLTIFVFTGSSSFNHVSSHTNTNTNTNTNQLSLLSSQYSLIAELNQKLNSTTLFVEALLVELSHMARDNSDIGHKSSSNERLWQSMYDQIAAGKNINNHEVKLAIGPHKLPLGTFPPTGSDYLLPSFGAGCLKLQDELARYMTYDIGGECPVDDVFAQKLMLKGCEPLPRRRCHPKSPLGYKEPTPFPDSLWSTPPDTSIIWDPYTCKNYKCLIDREKMPGSYDCKDCFNLQGRESSRWLYDNGGLDYGIDRVLATKPKGTIRIGLDIGGGSGSFAARMRERNVTIITTSMNFDGPFNSFIASRGLIPIHVSVSQRLPFFENTLDIVHSMHVLSNWIPEAMLELILYDIYRVLRPGGIFWLDHFFCVGPQLNGTYMPLIDRVGFTKLRWNAGMKLDRGADKNEWYFSALLEKPMT